MKQPTAARILRDIASATDELVKATGMPRGAVVVACPNESTRLRILEAKRSEPRIENVGGAERWLISWNIATTFMSTPHGRMRRVTRHTDRAGAKRFAVKWGLKLPRVKR